MFYISFSALIISVRRRTNEYNRSGWEPFRQILYTFVSVAVGHDNIRGFSYEYAINGLSSL